MVLDPKTVLVLNGYEYSVDSGVVVRKELNGSWQIEHDIHAVREVLHAFRKRAEWKGREL